MAANELKMKVVDGAGAAKQARVIKAVHTVDEHSVALAERVLSGNRRGPAAHSKTRAQVRGGGRKPWRQKGTGRARQGSTRAIQWRGGGVAFGPGGANHSRSLNRKQRQLATRSALLDKSIQGMVVFVEGEFPAEPRSRLAKAFLDKLAIAGRVLVLLGEKEEQVKRAFRNLSNVKLMMASRLNALDIISADYLVVSPVASETISELLAQGEAPVAKTAPKADKG